MSIHSYLYKTKRWQKLRAAHLASEPLCRTCKRTHLVVAAHVVDHIRPHRGDLTVFYEIDNLQSLCAPCHSSTKQRDEWLDKQPENVDDDGYKLDGSW